MGLGKYPLTGPLDPDLRAARLRKNTRHLEGNLTIIAYLIEIEQGDEEIPQDIAHHLEEAIRPFSNVQGKHEI